MSQIMAPIDAIMREPPNVWLTPELIPITGGT